MKPDQITIDICRHWIAEGKYQQANQWLDTQEENSQTLLLRAMCQKENQLMYWEKAIQSLSDKPISKDLVLALGQAIKWSRIGYDRDKQLKYLQQIVSVLEETDQTLQILHWKIILANFLLSQGKQEEAMPILQETVRQAIQHKQRLLIISQGIILASIWLSQGQFEEVAALCLQIDQAAIERKNWIALASSRNMRASCWMFRQLEARAIYLLLDTGDFLVEKGAIAALNLIKARLAELQRILGKEKMIKIIRSRES